MKSLMGWYLRGEGGKKGSKCFGKAFALYKSKEVAGAIRNQPNRGKDYESTSSSISNRFHDDGYSP